MKPEMRHKLAGLSFEEKIRKVGELIRLARSVKRSARTPLAKGNENNGRLHVRAES